MAATTDKRRLVTTKELMEYCSIGRNNAYKLGKEIGAIVQIGHTNRYDLNVVDAYIEAKRLETTKA